MKWSEESVAEKVLEIVELFSTGGLKSHWVERAMERYRESGDITEMWDARLDDLGVKKENLDAIMQALTERFPVELPDRFLFRSLSICDLSEHIVRELEQGDKDR